jgi:tetratricopeptide (TPR) repeat protein
MAQLMAQEGRDSEAATAYEQFLSRNPGHLEALTNLAIVLTNMEMADSAQAIYSALLDRDDLTPRDYFNAGIGLFQSEQYALAAQAFEQVAAVAPESRDANYNLAQALYLIEDYDRLVPVSTKLVALDPYNQNSHTFYVRALLMSGAEEEAQEAYDYMEALPIEVHSLQLAPLTEGGGSVTGQIENRASEEGATIGVRIHFISSDGVDVGAADVDVQLTGLETSTSFRAELESDQVLLAYWYEITTAVPTVELPEEEPDTTGTGNGN